MREYAAVTIPLRTVTSPPTEATLRQSPISYYTSNQCGMRAGQVHKTKLLIAFPLRMLLVVLFALIFFFFSKLEVK